MPPPPRTSGCTTTRPRRARPRESARRARRASSIDSHSRTIEAAELLLRLRERAVGDHGLAVADADGRRRRRRPQSRRRRRSCRRASVAKRRVAARRRASLLRPRSSASHARSSAVDEREKLHAGASTGKTTTGRTSIVPNFADGIFAAHSSASSSESTSTGSSRRALLRLGERAVGDGRLAVAHADRLRRARRLERVAGDVLPRALELLGVRHVLAHHGALVLLGHRAPLVLVVVDQKHVLHRALLRGRLRSSTTKAGAAKSTAVLTR